MDQKEFQKVTKSIQNKVGKWADKIVVGQYTGKKVERKEGDTWKDEDGKMWEMKNGIARSISALEGAKTPWWCPVCEKVMNKYDTDAWRVHAKCLDCVAKDESRLKMQGKWDIEKKKGELRNTIAYLKDRMIELTYYHDYLTENIELQHFDHNTGNLLMVDKYTVDTEQLKKQLREDVVAMNKNLKDLEKELQELEENESEED